MSSMTSHLQSIVGATDGDWESTTERLGEGKHKWPKQPPRIPND